MSDVVDDVLDIIAEKGQVDRERLDPSAKLMDLNISSLDVVEIVFALEEKFNIEIPFNANNSQLEFETVGQVIEAVRNHMNDKATSA